MSTIVNTIGERIRMFRLRKNLSQDALGELAGLHGKYIGQLERGEKNATLESIEKVARALDVSFETLFEHILDGSTQNEAAKRCYELVNTLSSREQEAVFDLLKRILAYKQL